MQHFYNNLRNFEGISWKTATKYIQTILFLCTTEKVLKYND